MQRLRGCVRNQSGIGMIDLMFAVVAMAIIMGAAYMVLNAGQRSWLTSGAALALQDQMRRALDVMSSGIRSSGNTFNTIYVRVDQTPACPMIVYQVPLAASNLVGGTSWGAIIPGKPSQAQNGSMVWIHRSPNVDGSGNSCTGQFLVQQVIGINTWVPPVWDGAAWTTPGSPSGTIVGPPGTGTPQYTRVLASNLDTTGETALPPVRPFLVQAYQKDGITKTDWAPGTNSAWTSQVQQVEIHLRLRQTASIGATATLEQVIRIQVRNRYKQ